MAMALVFYSLLRGGFLAGTPADARIVNPFGVIAVGALVGMFADKAAQKLAEIFETLFKSADPRSDKLNAPVIDRIEPERIAAGTKGTVVLTIWGDRLGSVSSVRLNAEDRKPDTVTEQQVTMKLRPEDSQGCPADQGHRGEQRRHRLDRRDARDRGLRSHDIHDCPARRYGQRGVQLRDDSVGRNSSV